MIQSFHNKSKLKGQTNLKTSMTYRFVSALRRIGIKPDLESNANIAVLHKEIADLNGIEFSVSRFPDGEWMAKSTNVDGILTGGDATDNIEDMIRDAILTYYDIAPAYCDDIKIHSSNNREVVRQEVIATV